MKHNYINIYNNLLNISRNKNLFLKLEKLDTFSDRLKLFFIHFCLFLKVYKSELSKKKSQELFDFIFRQIDLSIREIGYGDVSVNKKMKEYVNFFYSILSFIEKWEDLDNNDKIDLIENYLNISKNHDFYIKYFDNFYFFLKKNTLNTFQDKNINININFNHGGS